VDRLTALSTCHAMQEDALPHARQRPRRMVESGKVAPCRPCAPCYALGDVSNSVCSPCRLASRLTAGGTLANLLRGQTKTLPQRYPRGEKPIDCTLPLERRGSTSLFPLSRTTCTRHDLPTRPSRSLDSKTLGQTSCIRTTRRVGLFALQTFRPSFRCQMSREPADVRER
jgi:hypothetical protein